MHNKRLHLWGSLFVFLILSYFSLFHKLGKQPMNMWDESSYALNAQEMVERGNPIEVYLLGKPDVYNSKPPLAIWCMAVCIKVFGFNELGARMASAIFGLLSALLLWLVGIKIFKNYWTALIFPLVLLSSYGFVGWHISRTGDTDSALAFWILLQSLLILGYTNSASVKKANLYLLLAGFAVSFGCLTKGIAGLTALPGIVAWLIYEKKLIATFRKKEFYIALLSFIILVIGYYWLRNRLTPGYFQAVWDNEIGGRLQRQDYLNQKTLPFYFYFESMYTQDRYFGWLFVLPVSMIYIFTRSSDKIKSIGIFFILIFFSISLLLAVSKTKLEWYDAPLYPLMAIIIGISFGLFITQKDMKYGLLFICVFCWPYYRVVSNNVSVAKGSSVGKILNLIRRKGHEKDSIHIINSDANFVVHFYAKKDCLKGHFSNVVWQGDKSLKQGSYILTQKYERDVDMRNAFVLQPILSYKECNYYKILDKK